VDAVGVCERDKTTSRPLDRRPGVPLDRLLQTVAQGIVDADVVSALGARMARLERGLGEEKKARIAEAAGGKGPSALAGALLSSLDPDQVREEAAARFDLAPEAEPTEEQWEAVERERMAAALRPFLDPGLREAVLEARRSLEQVLDESTRDELLLAGYDAEALRKAQTKLAEFREFIEENKEEIEALQILYSRPYRAGLRFYQIRALEEALKRPPLAVHEPASGIWSLYQAVEPEKVKGRGGKALVDLVALVRHALEPEGDLVPLAQQVEDRYQEWLAEKESLGIRFTPEQRAWLDAIKDHIASSLSMERDDFDQVPFNQMGGLGKAYKTFGDKLWSLMDELNRRLVA
jgi:type I restriction enzyme, R subunit